METDGGGWLVSGIEADIMKQQQNLFKKSRFFNGGWMDL
jgi:hypothetical protein